MLVRNEHGEALNAELLAVDGGMALSGATLTGEVVLAAAHSPVGPAPHDQHVASIIRCPVDSRCDSDREPWPHRTPDL